MYPHTIVFLRLSGRSHTGYLLFTSDRALFCSSLVKSGKGQGHVFDAFAAHSGLLSISLLKTADHKMAALTFVIL